MRLAPALLIALSSVMPQIAHSAELKVASGGAFKQVLNALAAQYQSESGNTLAIAYQTTGQHLALIRAGNEAFDVAILPPEAIDTLAKEGKIVPGTRANLAQTGVGVVVKAGAPKPDISTVEAFKQALLRAKSKVSLARMAHLLESTPDARTQRRGVHETQGPRNRRVPPFPGR